MNFEKNLEAIRNEIEADDAVREKALPLSRNAVRKCSQSIKESHRGDFKVAKSNLSDAYDMIIEAKKELENSEYVTKSRILDTAFQEFAEAMYVLSLLEKGTLEIGEGFDIPSRPHLTGLSDTIGELRRATLDALRRDDLDKAEGFLFFMEKIEEGLLTFDFPNALIPDLRRKCDVARSIIERTRADVTTAVRQNNLICEMRNLEHSMKKE